MRTGYNTRPYEKHLETFHSFSGGLNTITTPENMLDTELLDMLNEDIGDRGSLKRRHGMVKQWDISSSVTGKRQGYFRYYKTDGTFDEIQAIGGKLYRKVGNGYEEMTITYLGTFQTTRNIEAVQFGNKLYIATGSGLVVYDGLYPSLVTPYAPTTMEMIYLGTNALATNPEAHLQDTIGLVASIDYVYPTYTYSLKGAQVTPKIFSTKISGEVYEYAAQIRLASQTALAWPEPTSTLWRELSNNSYGSFSTQSVGDCELRVQMRKKGTTEILSEFIMPMSIVKASERPTPPPSNTINNCNRILIHWNRLFLYGDSENPASVYMSHLNAPTYFPTLNTLEFSNPRREALTTIIHYRNSLLAFTKSSVQVLFGTSPTDFRRIMLNTDVGCVSPNGACVMRNYVAFLSNQGVHVLKSVGYTEEKANVDKIDQKIDNVMYKDNDAILLFHDGQLHVTFPSKNTRFRYYYDLQAWTKDVSTFLNFTMMRVIDGVLYGQSKSSVGNTVYKFDKNVFTDDGFAYENAWESKYLSFGQPYHQKKLKELQILVAPKDESMSSKITIFADEEAVLSPDDSFASVDENGYVVWNVVSEPNLEVAGGTQFDTKWQLGESQLGKVVFALKKLRLSGKCLRTRVRFSNVEPKENQVVGFAYVFKVKKV